MKNLGIFIMLFSTISLALQCKKETTNIPIQTPVVETGNPHLDSILNSTPFEPLSNAELAAISLMREEEKLARDLYQEFDDHQNMQVFYNISQSEQMHMDAIKGLIDKYNLTDPIIDDSRGAFTDPILDSLYTYLKAQGGTDLVNSLEVGCFVEEFDINDLEELLDVVDNDDITIIFENLQRGSRNHLRSYFKKLQQQGVTYTPVILSQQEFDDIVNSDHEPGMGM